MKVFGTKRVQPSDADRIAAERLSTVAARFKAEAHAGFTETTIGEPADAAEPEAIEDSKEPHE